VIGWLAPWLVVALLQAAPGSPRVAVEAFRARAPQAAALLEQAARAHPHVASALRTLEAEARLRAGDRKGAQALAERTIEADPRWAQRNAWIAARAAMPADCRSAVGHLERILDGPQDPAWVPPAQVLALLVRARSRCGDGVGADAARRDLALRHPGTAAGAYAAESLSLDAESQLRLAESLDRTADYRGAQRVLERLLPTEVGEEARFRLGVLHLKRLREDFRIAERAFADVEAAGGERAEEAAYLRARALGRAGDPVGARRAYDAYLAKWPEGAHADDARFFRVFLDYEHRRYAAAAKGFEALRDNKSWKQSAQWYHAWSLYLAGDSAAVAALDALADASPPGRIRTKARYWAGRAVMQRDPALGAERLKAVAAAQPMSWYGLLVRRLHPDLAPKAAGPLTARAIPAAPAPPKSLVPLAKEVRALASAGLTGFGRRALADASRRIRKARAWDLSNELSARVLDYTRLFRTAVVMNQAVFDALPVPEDATLWAAAYPTVWPELVVPAATRWKVAPTLVYSFIRKESAFDPDAVSHANAFGLMQLLPRTARRILDARGEGEDSPPPDLFQPATNIDLGTWYVGALAERFQGQLPLVAAAYNAGPPPVIEWLRGRTRIPTDEFVETIPYRETRGYVKRMARTWVAYRIVHEGLDPDRAAEIIPLALSGRVEPGVEF
jgi:soluble lytic murein transglycosylase